LLSYIECSPDYCLNGGQCYLGGTPPNEIPLCVCIKPYYGIRCAQNMLSKK